MSGTRLPFKDRMHDVIRDVFVIYNEDYGFMYVRKTPRAWECDIVQNLPEATCFESSDNAQWVINNVLSAGLRFRSKVRKVQQTMRLLTHE